MSAPESSALSRWGMPLFVLGVGVGMSLLVERKSPGLASTELLVGLPLVGLVTLVIVRAAAGPAGRMGDLVLTLLLAFIVGLHVLLLGVKLGMTDRFDLAVPIATAVLFVVLAPAVAILEPGSPMGLRTRATLADPALWARTHRRLGVAFGAAGVVGGVALALAEPTVAVVVMGGVPAIAMAVLARAAAREHAAQLARPMTSAHGSVDDPPPLR